MRRFAELLAHLWLHHAGIGVLSAFCADPGFVPDGDTPPRPVRKRAKRAAKPRRRRRRGTIKAPPGLNFGKV